MSLGLVIYFRVLAGHLITWPLLDVMELEIGMVIRHSPPFRAVLLKPRAHTNHLILSDLTYWAPSARASDLCLGSKNLHF